MSDDVMMEEFRVEAEEMFEEAECGILAIDKGDDFNDQYNKIFRAFHSLKGAAGMFELNSLQAHMHKLESSFETQKDETTLTKEQIDYLLMGIDKAKQILGGESIEFEYLLKEDFCVLGRGANTNSGTDINEKVETNNEEHYTEKNPEKPANDHVENISEISELRSLNIKNNDIKIRQDKKQSTIFILDVEDEILNQLEHITHSTEFNTHTFFDIQNILNKLESQTPDVILFNFDMPGDSVNFIKSIKSRFACIPIICISNSLTDENLIEAFNVGAFSFIEKPINEIKVLVECRNAVFEGNILRLLDQSIQQIIYQFSDLDKYLEQTGKCIVREKLKVDLQKILENRNDLKNIG